MRFWLWGHLVVKVGGLSNEGVHHAGIELCGGGVIDKGNGREGWQAVGSAGLGSIGVCGACYRRPLGLRAYIESLSVFHNPRTPTACGKTKTPPHPYRALQP